MLSSSSQNVGSFYFTSSSLQTLSSSLQTPFDISYNLDLNSSNSYNILKI